jgi:hypothetical protein
MGRKSRSRSAGGLVWRRSSIPSVSTNAGAGYDHGLSWAATLVRIAASLAGSLALTAWATLAIVHADDRYLVNHVSGAWMALAQYANDGILYPPLFDGQSFGGTRQMPLQILGLAGFARVTGEYLVSGKLFGYAVTLALIASVAVILRRRFGVPWWLTIALVGSIVVGDVGLYGTLSIRGHALPIVLQLVALAVVTPHVTERRAAMAGLVCAAAVLTKTTALWAPLAIFVWLVHGHRRTTGVFLATWLGALVVGLGVTEVTTEGRFSDNLLGLSASAFPGVGSAVYDAQEELFASFAGSATLGLFPIAAAAWIVSVRRRAADVYDHAWAFSVVLTVVILADIGAGARHALDLQVLTALVAARAWRRHGATGEGTAIVWLAIPLAVVWGIGASFSAGLANDTRDALRSALGRGGAGYRAEPLKGIVRGGDSVLSEDPSVSVAVGRHPVVLDPFTLNRIVRDHPRWEANLVDRIDRHAFDRVVLFARGGALTVDVDDPAWRTLHFSVPIIGALARSYRAERIVGPYLLLVPRSGPAERSK